MADNEPPAAAAAAPLPPPAVMPPPANNNRRMGILVAVCMWASVNTVVFDVVALIAGHTHCRKSTWVFRCLALTHTTAAELSALVDGGLLCSTVAGLSAVLHILLTDKTSCTSRSCGRWAVDALAWVALVATAAVHCTEVASGSISLTAHPEDDTYFYVHVFLASLCLIVDLLVIAGLLLCSCSPRRRKLGEQGDGEPV